MPSTDERPDLLPRDEPGAVRSFSFALVVHLLLAAALTWGVSWKSNDPTVTFEAELWSNVQQEAAPALEATLWGCCASALPWRSLPRCCPQPALLPPDAAALLPVEWQPPRHASTATIDNLIQICFFYSSPSLLPVLRGWHCHWQRWHSAADAF